jgi:nucleotide-binding universal stress UspA family protein
MRILLATDGSEYSEAAVEKLARHPFPADSEVLVLSVFEPPPFPFTVPGGGVNFDAQIQETAEKAVERAATRLQTGEESRKLQITTNVLAGSPKRVIVEEAEAFGADLIVVGSRGLGAWDRLLLGSVSQAVATHAKCSVVIVRSRVVK